METLDDILALLTPAVLARSSAAKSTKTCKICTEPAIEFRSELSKFEYSVSAICQQCQDRLWGSGQ